MTRSKRARKEAEKIASPEVAVMGDILTPNRLVPAIEAAEMTSSAKKGGLTQRFTEDENIEVLSAFIEGKSKLQEKKQWSKSGKFQTFQTDACF